MPHQQQSEKQAPPVAPRRSKSEPKKNETPVPTPRTRRKNRDALNQSLDQGIPPKAKPRKQTKPEQTNIYDVPSNLKKVPVYDVPGNLKKVPIYDVPPHRNKSTDYDVPKNLNVKSSPLPSSPSEKEGSNSIDPSTEENIYQSIDDMDFELEMLEMMLESKEDSQHLDDASNFMSLYEGIIRLEFEMSDLIKIFQDQRPSKSNTLEWAAHMKQEKLLMKQQSENHGFDKLKKSIEPLVAKGLTTAQERDKVSSRVDKLNEALTPALTAKYGADGAKQRLLKAPKG
ncbi:hypothetical protein [Endozoicomonas sp. 4G]|uniref:hypothetical protein n=1 Tax=Endozoicomonas sp. 4G TaxID=2872754 RepID=UPI00207885CB|nr:hypothetical protein [Endozoicomonas sp. 4G]